MQIRLKSLSLENFKGIIKQDIEFEDNTFIYLENEGGKTTILDAFLWLLFGKDSLNQADFEIKTICSERNKANFPDNEIGDVIHNLEHSVEGCLVIDGKDNIFKKVYKEKWVKKRGATRKEFTGHETEHFLDEVPVQKKEYLEVVSTIVDESLFRMLTDVREFNSIHWEKRREIVMELAGKTDETQIEGYSLIKDILDGKTIEGRKKIVAGRRKKINEQIKKIPTQIDEAAGFVIEVDADSKECSALIASSMKKKNDLEDNIKAMKSDDGQTNRRQQIAKIDAEIQEQKNAFESDRAEKRQELDGKLNVLKSEEEMLKGEIKNIQDSDERVKNEKSDLERKLDEVRAEWKEIANQEEDIEKTCPTCKQDLPEWDIQKTIDRHNVEKSKALEELKKTGVELSEKIENLKGNTMIHDRIEERENRLSEISKEYAGLVKQSAELAAKSLDLKELEYKKEVLEEERKKQVAPDTSELEKEVTELDTVIETARKSIVDIQKNQEYRDRIKELEESEKNLSLEYAKLEGDLDNIDKFIVAKVNYIEEKVNGMFKIARFKMFHEQINEGIRDVCETMKDGVPYNSVNNAGRIQVGVDIINTLQKFHKIECPIWIDNRESVTEIPETDCQIISLFVSPEDKTMRIENG